MGVVEERQGNEAEFARAWVEGRSQVLRAITRSFPMAGSAMVDAAVDQAWVELYEQGQAGTSEALLGRWRGLAYLRALNGLRERRRHPVSPVPVEELAETGVIALSRAGAMDIGGLRAEARAQEIVHQVSGDARRWVELVIDDPSVPPREVARRLGWDREKLKSVTRRTRARLREFVSARASGVICERRQAVMEAFAATNLVQRDPAHAMRLEERAALRSELYEQVALHIAGCEECERAWRNAQSRLLRPRLVFIPTVLAGKFAAAGGSALAAGRRVLGRLDRLLGDLRIRVGSSMGRASAGGAAGTAGTAGALAGKGAAVCVGVLCATGVGTAALVGIPAGVIAPRVVARHHHATIAAHHDERRPISAVTATVLGSADSATTTGAGVASGARSGVSSSRTDIDRSSTKPTRPVTPGSLVATSATTNASKVKSKPSARAASTSAPTSQSEVSTEYSTSAGSSSSGSTSSSSAKHGPCVPGSLSC
jgi:hypothetical protein